MNSGTEAAIASFAGPLEPPTARMDVFTEAVLAITHRPLEGSAGKSSTRPHLVRLLNVDFFGRPATSSKSLAAGLYTIYHPLLDLRAHPRTRTTLTVQSLNSAQPPSQPLYVSSRAAAINASTLSILNAGSIGMRGVPMAVAIAVIPIHGKGKQRAYDDVEEDQQMEQVANGDDNVTLVLDPTRNEEQSSVARFCFGWAFGQEFSSAAPKEKGHRERSDEEEQDEEAECVYLESDGEFDGATVSLSA